MIDRHELARQTIEMSIRELELAAENERLARKANDPALAKNCEFWARENRRRAALLRDLV